MIKVKNTGVIDIGPLNHEWHVRGKSGILFEDRKVDWKKYLPTEENQYQPKKLASLNSVFDTFACVSFSAHNAVEVQGNWAIKEKVWSEETVKALEELGLVVNGQFNCSDRFLAKMSNTTKDGNSLGNVAETMRKVGLLAEKDWPFTPDIKSWEEYYKEIPKELIEKAAKVKEILDIQSEWCFTSPISTQDLKEVLAYHVKHVPIQIAAYICPDWSRYTATEDKIIQGCGFNDSGHATIIYGVEDFYNDFDHYPPYQKKLAIDYPIKYGMKIVVSEKVKPKNRYNFQTNLSYGQKSNEVKKLQEALIELNLLKAGLNTGYYLDLTAEALYRFQVKFKVPVTWYEKTFRKGMDFGPKTRKVINSLNSV